MPQGTTSVRWVSPAARGAGEAARGVGGGQTSLRSEVRGARTFSKSPRVDEGSGGGEVEREGVRAGVGGGEAIQAGVSEDTSECAKGHDMDYH